MTARPSATREVFGGSARVFVAEAISLPTGLITAAFLARRFGPSDYGIFTLTMAIVVWLEWTLSSLLGRSSREASSPTPRTGVRRSGRAESAVVSGWSPSARRSWPPDRSHR